MERAVRPIERSLHHGWQLQFLVVGFVALFTGVSLAATHKLLAQLHLGSNWGSRCTCKLSQLLSWMHLVRMVELVVLRARQ